MQEINNTKWIIQQVTVITMYEDNTEEDIQDHPEEEAKVEVKAEGR